MFVFCPSLCLSVCLCSVVWCPVMSIMTVTVSSLNTGSLVAEQNLKVNLKYRIVQMYNERKTQYTLTCLMEGKTATNSLYVWPCHEHGADMKLYYNKILRSRIGMRESSKLVLSNWSRSYIHLYFANRQHKKTKKNQQYNIQLNCGYLTIE